MPNGHMETKFLVAIEPDVEKAHVIIPLLEEVGVFHVKTQKVFTSYTKNWRTDYKKGKVAVGIQGKVKGGVVPAADARGGASARAGAGAAGGVGGK